MTSTTFAPVVQLADTRALGYRLSTEYRDMTLVQALAAVRLADTGTLRWAATYERIDYCARGVHRMFATRSQLIMSLIEAWAERAYERTLA